MYYDIRDHSVADAFQYIMCVPLQTCTPHYSNVREVAACCRRTAAAVEST